MTTFSTAARGFAAPPAASVDANATYVATPPAARTTTAADAAMSLPGERAGAAPAGGIGSP